MKFQIHKISGALTFGLLVIFCVSCKKKGIESPALSASNIYINQASLTDTLSTGVSAEKDSIYVVKLQTGLKDYPTSDNHTATLGIDTAKMSIYRAKYGKAETLPASCYFLPIKDCKITSGNAVSSSAQINLLNQSQLGMGKTYVLPVVIKTIDGKPTESQAGQVIFLLIKTKLVDFGNPISKTGWKITNVSSERSSTTLASNVLDNNIATNWSNASTNPTMPQAMTIDMVSTYNLKSVTYLNQVNFSSGANPSQIRIELSTDGNAWTNKGVFSFGAANANLKYLKMNPVTSARYIRFTVLKSSPYVVSQSLGTINYDLVSISEIGANN